MDEKKKEEVLQRIQQLHDKFRLNLEDRMISIDSAWAQVQNTPGDEAIQQDLYRAVHSIAGTAGTFGFPELGISARKLVNVLKEWQKDPVNSLESQQSMIIGALDLLRTDIKKIVNDR